MPVRNESIVALERSGSGPSDPSEYYFDQPCKLCLNDRCAIHDQTRPAICGDYTCKLLVNHAAGKVSLADAKALVHNVKVLRDRLRPQLEEFTDSEAPLALVELTRLAVNRMETMDAAARSSVSSGMLLDLALMRILLAKHFDSRLTRHTYLADKAMQTMDAASDSQAQQQEEPGK
ncbi:MAG: hypothetical protein GC183_10350 [Thiobacillus sp.]|nr:hypothetical protein [Thiobacillus sp.]